MKKLFIAPLVMLVLISAASPTLASVSAQSQVTIFDLKASNMTDSSFTISWVTNLPSEGHVRYSLWEGDYCPLSKTQNDVRGASTVDDTHYVQLGELLPNTLYCFQAISDSTVKYWPSISIRTAPTLTIPQNDIIYGQVKENDGTTNAEGAIVLMRIQDNDGTGNGRSNLLSALVQSNGFWSVNLGNARTPDDQSFFHYSSNGGDLLLLDANSVADGTANAQVDTGNDKPAPTMTLDNIPPFTIHLDAAWNLISNPVRPAPGYDAQAMLDEVREQGNPREVDKWNSGQWQGFVDGYPFNNFGIITGEGYFLKMASSSIWITQGGNGSIPAQPPNASTNQHINQKSNRSLSPRANAIQLNAGWNLIAQPYWSTCKYTAQSITNEIQSQGGSPIEIDQWNAGSWQGFVVGYPFNNFNIQKGQGYFVKVNAASTWTPCQ